MRALPDHRHRLVAVAVLVTGLLAGCSALGGEPGPGGTFQELPAEGEPAGIEDVVQHLFEAPTFPDPVGGEGQMVELRSPDVSRRHHFFLAEHDGGGELAEPLLRGAAVRLPDGASLALPEGASIARLDGTTVTDVSNCDAPCTATGPALVAPLDWFQGIRTAADWELLVPAPTE